MLFIDNRHREIGKLYLLTQQRMCADHHRNLSRGNLRLYFFFLFWRHRTGQQSAGDAQFIHQRIQRLEMLLRQQFGRRHQRRLLAVVCCNPAQRGGNHRLAGTDITLHQTAERSAGRDVQTTLLNRPHLCPRERKRQGPIEILESQIAERNTAGRGAPLPQPSQSAGQQKQLFKYQSAPRCLRLFDRLRAVNQCHRLLQVRERIPVAHILRQIVRHLRRKDAQRRTGDGLHILLMDSGSQRINRKDASGLVSSADRLKLRIDHDEPASLALNLSEKRVFPALQRRGGIAVVKKPQRHRTGLVIGHPVRDIHAAADVCGFERCGKHRMNAERLTLRQVADTCDHRAVLISSRVAFQRIVQRSNSKPFERLCLFRSYPADKADFILQRHTLYSRTTRVTTPRTTLSSPGIGGYASFSGISQRCPSFFTSRLQVASSSMIATTIW